MNTLILFLFVRFINAKCIKTPTMKLNGGLVIKMGLGSTFFEKVFQLNLQSNLSWFEYTSPVVLSNAKNISTGVFPFFFEKENVSYSVLNTSLFFLEDSIIVENFTMIYFDMMLYSLDTLSLSKDNNNTLVHYLYRSKAIDSLSFSLISRDNDETFLVFGESKELIKKKYKHTLNVDEHWRYKISKVTIEGIAEYECNDYVYFQANTNDILIPSKAYKYISVNYLDSLVDKGKCFYDAFIMKDYYECDCGIANELPNFYFVIDNRIFTLRKKDILIRKRFNCKLVFRENNFDNTSWVFGTPFLSGYSFMFDYEKSSIDIFSDEQILNIHNSIGQKEIMIINILLCFICSIMNIINK